MSRIGILGGGFAGVWCAAGAKRTAAAHGADLDVTLVSAGDDMVIRPRLYEDDPQRLRVSLDRVLGPIGVRRVAATVTDIDVAGRTVGVVERDGTRRSLPYDRLVVALGSRLVRPDIEGAEYVFDVDSLPGAARLHAHLGRLASAEPGEGRWTIVVVGAGFTGLEVATEMVHRLRDLAAPERPRIVLLDRSPVTGKPLGPGPHAEIEAALSALGVETRLGVTVERVEPEAVHLSDGTTIPTRTVIWTVGMLASPLTEQIPADRDRLGRLAVDEYLAVVGVPGVYAAGDTAAAEAEPGHTVLQCCQHAVPQGKFVGVNVAADLLGLDRVPFAPDPYVTCLDLGEHGAVLTLGWDRQVQQTGADAKKLKQSINADWIYPPVDDAETILRFADHRTTWPTADLG